MNRIDKVAELYGITPDQHEIDHLRDCQKDAHLSLEQLFSVLHKN